MRWKVFYSDGKTISSEDCTPFSIERRVNVQVIIQEDPNHGWVALTGYDYYMWDARGGRAKWFKGNDPGWFQYITSPGSKCVLLGEFIDTKAYNEIFEIARKDMLFQKKTGFANDERKP
jgi:hypothetical protein